MSIKGMIEQMILDAGHLLIMSPKCHPKVAGVGVEFCWGKSKAEFRRHINNGKAADLKANILKSMSLEYLPLIRIRRFARKTTDYIRVYKDMMEKGVTSAHELDADSIHVPGNDELVLSFVFLRVN